MGIGRLLEREAELAALESAFDRVLSGTGSSVTIEGELGLGKSELLAVARERARAANFSVLAARASELERSIPFGVAGQLLGHSDVGAGAAEGDRALTRIQHLYDAVVGLTWPSADSGQTVPLVLAVDDLQWADEPSLRFLAYLTLRLDDLPVCLLASVRTGEPGTPEALIEPLRGYSVLRPRPLSEPAVASLAREQLGPDLDDAVCRACSEASAGNPFYLHELLRALRSDGTPPSPERVRGIAPEAVLRSLMVRLGRLGADAAALARALAVIGDGVPLGQVAAFAELDLPAAERAADALAFASIVEPGEPLSFTHPLIGSALRADMGTFESAAAHRRAAQLLLEHDAPAERVATHLLRVRPEGDEGAVATLRAAAATAAERGDAAAAARLLRRALEEPPPAAVRTDLLLELAEAEVLSGSPDARGHLEQALEQLTEPRRRALALAPMATLAHHAGDYLEAVDLARRARAQIDPGDPLDDRLQAIELGAAVLHPETQASAAATMESLLSQARGGRAPSAPALLANLAGQLGRDDPPSEVRSLAQRAIADDPLIDRADPGSAIGWVGCALVWVDELELAERWLDAAVDAARGRGGVLAGSIAALRRAEVHYHRGRLDEAIADAEHALDVFRAGWVGEPWSVPMLARAHITRGDLDAAAEAIAIGNQADRARPEHALLLEADARLQLARGDAATALERARAAGDHIELRYGVALPRIFSWRRLAALAAHRLGRAEEVGELIDPALARLREIGPARQLGATLVAAGLIEGGDAGIALLEEAVAVLERSPARPQRALALLELGAALRRAGRRSAAKEPLLAALELADRIDALPLAERARGELASLGTRPRRPTRSGVESLTPSERRIAELVARGLSNPQVAHELSITRKTVETHLRHVYRKLDVTSRRELPGALAAGQQARSA